MLCNFRGVPYRVVFHKRMPKGWAKHDGYCSPRDSASPTVGIRRGMDDERELEVTIHEAIHACHWDLSEEAVEQTASDLGRMLWALGWRKT